MSFSFRPIHLALIISIAVFIIIISVYLIKGLINHERQGRETPFFQDWGRKIFYTITDKPPELIAKKIGINAEEYLYSCEILKVRGNLEEIIILKLFGFLVVVVSVVSTLFTFDPVILIFGLLIGIVCAFIPGQKINVGAKARRDAVLHELPRFLDLLETALYINLPIEEAISITTENLEGTVLAEEFNDALSDVKLGARNWQGALEKVAKKFDIDEFSDFVLDLTISYNKGLNIHDMVVKRNKNLKQTNLFWMRERAMSLNNTILIPITVFEMVPLLALMMLPLILQLNTTNLF